MASLIVILEGKRKEVIKEEKDIDRHSIPSMLITF